jgi:hypothetical protein
MTELLLEQSQSMLLAGERLESLGGEVPNIEAIFWRAKMRMNLGAPCKGRDIK